MAGAQPRPLAGRGEGLEVGRVTWSEAVTARLLPLPDELEAYVAREIASWNAGGYSMFQWPRSEWLRRIERALALYFPASTSRDRSLTARHYAPFPLAAGHDVP